MIKKIVLATGNKSKVKEITAALSDIPEFNGITVVSMKDESIDIDIKETGSTYVENAVIKAKKICEMTGLPAMANVIQEMKSITCTQHQEYTPTFSWRKYPLF